ncbi:hypothetical protein BRC65_03620 [Halobacteriales archaeon QH_2_65_14]|jgi:uncharacterized membrane protein YfcA|nr:MAG: hypothetical protein BRC65_03620 [Halobacteriales archaeon QH_2_65_14]
MSINQTQWSRNALARAGLFVVASTVALTASFLGVVGLLAGEVSGLSDRLPFYVLVMALSFVAAIITFEEEYRDAVRSLQLSVSLAAATFLLATFGGEGVAFLYQNHEEVVASQLLFYILAAGLIGTGIGYWTLHHWSELKWNGPQL